MLERKREPTVNALAPLVERASSLNVRVRPLSFVSARPAADICNVAEVKRADLVVLGWHKPLLGKTVLGGTVHEVMENAKADVAVLIDRGLRELTKILVPYQGTIHDKAALRLAQRICKHAKTTVTILHVVSPSRPSDAPRLGVASQVQQTFEQEDPTLAGRVIFSVAEHTNPARAAVAEAGRGYDLVIVGAGQEWGLEHRIFGLQPETIIQDCPTSLLVVRQYEPEREPVSARSADAGPSKFAPVTPKT
jgi:nucleotide-binding universal stress UspA family protein